jgi:tRNA threonylcarbamoyladenosine biosynthesis protein TsaB
VTEWVAGPVLGIETTGRMTGAAVFDRGRLLAESALDARAHSQELLLSQVESLLVPLGLSVRDLARIGVALGPGSFTGVRVGLAAARGLAVGADRPLCGVPSHEALAWPFRDLGALTVLLTGLRRGELFFEAGTWVGDSWSPVEPGAGIPVADLRSRLTELRRAGPLLFVGEAAALPDVANETEGLGHFVSDPISSTRRPAVVACLSARVSAPAVAGAAIDAVEPLYLRAADARRPETPRA